MGQPAVIVRDDLDLEVDGRIVTHLRPDAALNLAADLARCAFRLIATEEKCDFLFDEPEAAAVGACVN